MTKQYNSKAMASIRETAKGLHALGVIDKRTMRWFNEACLIPLHPLTPRKSGRCASARQPD